MTKKEKMSKVYAPLHKPQPKWQVIIGLLLLWVMGMSFVYGRAGRGPEVRQWPYSQFKQALMQGRIEAVTIREKVIEGTFCQKIETNAKDSVSENNSGAPPEKPEELPFRTVRPSVPDEKLLPQLEQRQVTVRGSTNPYDWLWRLVLTLLPWVLIIGFFVYTSKKYRQMTGGGAAGGGIFGFGKSKAKRVEGSMESTTFDDVAGLDNAKAELQEVIAFLRDPSKFTSLGAELPKGMLLAGPPGVGKTLLAQATAGEAAVPFFNISGSEFIEMFVGVGASRVRDMFETAKKEAPSIIFIDELDSIGRARGAGLGGGHDEREQTLNQILSEMDGFSPREGTLVLAATNRPDVLDPALIRPGRFDRRITLNRPRKKARRMILEIHTRGMPLYEDVDLNRLARETAGFSGADLKNLVNESALLAARKEKERIGMDDMEQARDKILMGLPREDTLTREDREAVAYHEAGHALVAAILPETDPLQKVTIIPRGMAMGATEQIPEEDRTHLRKSDLLHRIAILLGGRASERLVFEDLSTGAANDLEKATQIARRMISRWGMSDALGPAAFRSGNTHPFLGKELAEQKDFSEHTARRIDDEIVRILEEMEQKAETLLRDHRAILDALAKELLEQETLSSEQIESIVNVGMEEMN